jgi:hypothetical protein
MATRSLNLTRKDIQALCAGRTNEQIGDAVRHMLAPGKKRKELDLDKLVRMRMAGCTIPEIAAELNVSEKTVDNRLRDDPLFKDMFVRGNERGKAALRMKTFSKGVLEGDLGALVWSTKNRLGWADKQEIAGAGGTPLFDVAAFRAMTDAAVSAAKDHGDKG